MKLLLSAQNKNPALSIFIQLLIFAMLLTNATYSHAQEDGDAPEEKSVDGAEGADEEEVGELLLSAVHLARLSGVHAEGALLEANRRFQKRFSKIEKRANVKNT